MVRYRYSMTPADRQERREARACIEADEEAIEQACKDLEDMAFPVDELVAVIRNAMQDIREKVDTL